jgi:hypothetical protein
MGLPEDLDRFTHVLFPYDVGNQFYASLRALPSSPELTDQMVRNCFDRF